MSDDPVPIGVAVSHGSAARPRREVGAQDRADGGIVHHDPTAEVGTVTLGASVAGLDQMPPSLERAVHL